VCAVDHGAVPLGRPRPCARLALALALVLAGCCLPAAATAASPFERDKTPLPSSISGNGADAGPVVQSGSSGSGALRMLFGLAIVLALIYGLYRLLKRSADRNGEGIRAHGQMTVVASTPLAQSRALHLVRVGGELVLVGSSEQGVTKIRVYDSDEVRRLGFEAHDDLHQLSTSVPGERIGFRSALLETLRKKTAR
jgi:flagellar biosynthetic protein FliO